MNEILYILLLAAFLFFPIASEANTSYKEEMGFAKSALLGNNGDLTKLETLANSKNVVAEAALGYYYLKKDDYKKSLFYSKESASKGYPSGEDGLAFLYFYGKGVTKNPSEAFYWYQKSAFKSNADGEAGLGYLYFYGLGTRENRKASVYWFAKAALKNNPLAFSMLSLMYMKGIVLKKNYKYGIYYIEKAAIKGFPLAEYDLGYYCYHGIGIKENSNEALYWWRKAAKKGDSAAQKAIDNGHFGFGSILRRVNGFPS